MLTWLEDRVIADWRANPLWVRALGVARSLLAVGSLITVGLTDHGILFGPAAGLPPGPRCEGAFGFTIFCVPGLPVGVLRLLAAAILVVVASGWRPRWTCLPHWYVSWSLYASATLVDGGDQVTAVLTLMLIPVSLADPRQWHWQRADAPADEAAWRVAVPVVTRFAIRFQLAALYFQAAVAKLGVEQWADGTATHYWLSDPTFGAEGLLGRALDAAATVPALQAALTWSPLVIEFGIALAILFGSLTARRAALAAGFALHAGIALTMGIMSFSLAMFGALLLALWWPAAPRETAAEEEPPATARPRAEVQHA